ncbi:MAG: oligosaccharide flippase family protein [Candidatus Pacearchaeota archaeon]
MKINFKLIRQFAFFSSADILGLITGLISAPISTRLLTIEQYGAIPTLQAIWAAFVTFQFGGMDWAYPFFASNRKYDIRSVQATSFYVASFSSILVWFIYTGWLFLSNFGYKNAGMNFIELTFFVSSILPRSLIDWYLYSLRFQLKEKHYAKISVFLRVLSLIPLPILILFEQEDRLAIYIALTSILTWICFFWSFISLRDSNYEINFRFFSFKILKDMLGYSLLLTLGGAIYSLFVVADRFLISVFHGSKEMAIFNLAANIGGLVLLAKALFGRIFEPYLVQWIANESPKIYLPKLQKTLDLLALFMSFYFLIFLLWSKHIVGLIFPRDYIGSAYIIPLIALSGAISSLSLVLVASTLIAKKKQFHMVVYSIGLIINSALGIVLIPKIGASGAVWGTILGEFAILISWLVIDRKFLRVLNLKMNFVVFVSLITIFFSFFWIFLIDGYLIIKLRFFPEFMYSLILSIILLIIWGVVFRWRIKA